MQRRLRASACFPHSPTISAHILTTRGSALANTISSMSRVTRKKAQWENMSCWCWDGQEWDQEGDRRASSRPAWLPCDLTSHSHPSTPTIARSQPPTPAAGPACPRQSAPAAPRPRPATQAGGSGPAQEEEGEEGEERGVQKGSIHVTNTGATPAGESGPTQSGRMEQQGSCRAKSTSTTTSRSLAPTHPHPHAPRRRLRGWPAACRSRPHT